MINIFKKRLVTKRLVLASPRLMALVMVLLFLITACVSNASSSEKNISSSSYTSEKLAKEWHEQVKKNPFNPYEIGSFPSDNDSEYDYPDYRAQGPQMLSPTSSNINPDWMEEYDSQKVGVRKAAVN